MHGYLITYYAIRNHVNRATIKIAWIKLNWINCQINHPCTFTNITKFLFFYMIVVITNGLLARPTYLYSLKLDHYCKFEFGWLYTEINKHRELKKSIETNLTGALKHLRHLAKGLYPSFAYYFPYFTFLFPLIRPFSL